MIQQHARSLLAGTVLLAIGTGCGGGGGANKVGGGGGTGSMGGTDGPIGPAGPDVGITAGAGGAGGGAGGATTDTGGLADAGPPPTASACVTTTRCSRSGTVTPCPSGYDCNDQLAIPVCTMLYCSPEGTSCAASVQCGTGVDCVDQAFVCRKPTPSGSAGTGTEGMKGCGYSYPVRSGSGTTGGASYDCAPGLICLQPGTASSRCAKANSQPAGSPCPTGWTSYLDYAQYVSTGGKDSYCANGLFCHSDDTGGAGTCTAWQWAELGQACGGTVRCVGDATTPPTARCDDRWWSCGDVHDAATCRSGGTNTCVSLTADAAVPAEDTSRDAPVADGSADLPSDPVPADIPVCSATTSINLLPCKVTLQMQGSFAMGISGLGSGKAYALGLSQANGSQVEFDVYSESTLFAMLCAQIVSSPSGSCVVAPPATTVWVKLKNYDSKPTTATYTLSIADAVGASGTMSKANPMRTARTDFTGTLLSSGKVLIAGGTTSDGDYTTACEVYDPTTGTFASTGSMATGRTGHTATILPNGKVLMVGGFSAGAGAELYDPTTGTFSGAGGTTIERWTHTATTLADGKVLIMGGENNDSDFQALADTEIYDPSTNTFVTTGSPKSPREQHTATLLPNGRVLLAGGRTDSNPGMTSAELYDPATGTFAPTGSLAVGRRLHSAVLLSSGKVLVVGGYDGSGSTICSSTAELYDPESGAFSPAGKLVTRRNYGPSVTLLSSGKVLVAGGGMLSTEVISMEIYDPVTDTFKPTVAMSEARESHSAVLLANGKVLVAGGHNHTYHSEGATNDNTLGSVDLFSF